MSADLMDLLDQCIVDMAEIANSTKEEFDKRSAAKKRVRSCLIDVKRLGADVSDARGRLRSALVDRSTHLAGSAPNVDALFRKVIDYL
jgi:hypothetical protein